MPKVLIVEDEAAIADLVRAVFADEGYQVAILGDLRADVLRVAVGKLEPDCILLDSDGPGGYGESWSTAAWLHDRSRPVPTIMFTAHHRDAEEARAGESTRARRAGFRGVISKPFNIDDLLEEVARCSGSSVPFDQSEPAEQARTAALVERLRAGGARDIHASTRREWATFRTADGTLVQLYWWQRDGVYYVLRYSSSGSATERVGQFYDLDAAIALAMTVAGEPSDEGT